MHKLSLSTMIFSSFIFLFRRRNIWNSYFQSFHLHDQLPVGLQLKRCTGNAEVGVRIPASMNFSAFFPRNCGISCDCNCDDLLFIYFLHSAVTKHEIHIFIVSFTVVRLNSYAFYPQIFLKYKLTWIGSFDTLTSTLRWVTQSVHSQGMRP